MARTVDPVRSAEQRARIAAAAATVFAERGYDGAATAAIARAAGVGSGTLFHYFGDKRSLMVALFTDDHAADHEAIAALDGDHIDPLVGLGRLLDHLCRDVADPAAPGLVVAMLQLAVRDEAFSDLLDAGDARLREALARLLRRAVDAGEVAATTDPVRAARWLQGLVDTLYLMCGDDDFDPVVEVAELRRIAAAYLGAPGLAAPPEAWEGAS